MKVFKQLQVVFLMGPPGAGKGTQAELLSDKLGFFHLETSKVLEAAFSGATRGAYVQVGKEKFFMRNEKVFWETGKLCSPPFVTQVMANKIAQLHKDGKSLVLSGSPRTVYEVERLFPFLLKLYGKRNLTLVVLTLSQEQSVYRNSHRRICALMRHPILWSKETAKLTACPLDGSPIQKRKGLDDPATIQVRLKEFETRTRPVLAYFAKKGVRPHKVNGDQPVVKVFENIQRVVL